MKITDVRIRPVLGREPLLALASVTFDRVFVVHDIRILDSSQGLYLAMPSRRKAEGGYQDIAHPIDYEMRRYLEDKILSRYEQQRRCGLI